MYSHRHHVDDKHPLHSTQLLKQPQRRAFIKARGAETDAGLWVASRRRAQRCTPPADLERHAGLQELTGR